MNAIKVKSLGAIFLGVSAGCAIAQQTLPSPTVNHHAAGWMFNRPAGTVNPDWYTYSDGTSTQPNSAPVSAYDKDLVVPTAAIPPDFCTAGQTTFCRINTGATLLALSNVPASGDSAYVDFPFTPQNPPSGKADVVLNQAV